MSISRKDGGTMSTNFKDTIDRALMDTVYLKNLKIKTTAEAGGGEGPTLNLIIDLVTEDGDFVRVRDAGHIGFTLINSDGSHENLIFADIENLQMPRAVLAFTGEDAKDIVKKKQLLEIKVFDTDLLIVDKSVVDIQNALVGLYGNKRKTPLLLKNKL